MNEAAVSKWPGDIQMHLHCQHWTTACWRFQPSMKARFPSHLSPEDWNCWGQLWHQGVGALALLLLSASCCITSLLSSKLGQLHTHSEYSSLLFRHLFKILLYNCLLHPLLPFCRTLRTLSASQWPQLLNTQEQESLECITNFNRNE